MFSRIGEKIIQKAVNEGVFENLSGKGKPLPIAEEANIPPDWRMAFRILKNANIPPRWIQLDKEIRDEFKDAHADLETVSKDYGGQAVAWNRAVIKFTLRINQVNESLRKLNLIVPKASFQRRVLDPEEEIRHILAR